MIRYIFTKDASWLEKWDDFNFNHPKGSHLSSSDWLKSYQSYGFDFELGLMLDNDDLIGGYGVILPKFSVFKFYILPHGPIYDKNHQHYLKEHLFQIKRRASDKGCCYLQLSMPISSNPLIETHTHPKETTKVLNEVLMSGKFFNYIYSSYGLNWIDLTKEKNAELYLEQLTPKVRRNVRMPYNKNASVSFVTDMELIEKGYDVIVENAHFGHYSVRSFQDIKSTIQNLIEKQRAYFVICKVNNDIKAAAFFVASNGYITNITGGVLREKPDIKLGYMLQWEMIKKSYELNYKGYNISMGGSEGVQDFKSKFGANAILYEHPHYHVILKPFHFKIFRIFNTYLKPYKAQVSKLLSRFKG